MRTILVASLIILFAANILAQQNDFALRELLKDFPIETIEAQDLPIEKDEWKAILVNHESMNWKVTSKSTSKQIVIANKRNTDNSSNSFAFGLLDNNDKRILVIIECFGENQRLQAWQMENTLQKKWQRLWMPKNPSLFEFLSENVKLPAKYFDALPFLEYELAEGKLAYKLNDYQLGNQFLKEGSDEMIGHCVKYQYQLIWNTNELKLELKKKLSKDFVPILDVFAKEVEDNPDGPGFFNFDCPSAVSISASSELASQGKSTYKASNMTDFEFVRMKDPDITAWSEGVPGDGINEWIEFVIDSDYQVGSAFKIRNGYVKSKSTWQENNRVKTMAAYLNGKVIANVHLKDTEAYQSFSVYIWWLKYDDIQKGDKIRFVIKDVYKGTKYPDTLISYFVPTGNCG